jgi:hypothetical protein
MGPAHQKDMALVASFRRVLSVIAGTRGGCGLTPRVLSMQLRVKKNRITVSSQILPTLATTDARIHRRQINTPPEAWRTTTRLAEAAATESAPVIRRGRHPLLGPNYWMVEGNQFHINERQLHNINL